MEVVNVGQQAKMDGGEEREGDDGGHCGDDYRHGPALVPMWRSLQTRR